MRSAVLAGLLLLAGCERKPAEQVVTVDLQTETAPAIVPAPAVTPEVKQPAPAVAPVAKQFQALGTEPFWSLDVMPGKLRYSSPENLKGTAFSSSETKDGAAVRYTGTLEGKAVTLTIEPGTCSDGMSDTVYPYKATFVWGDQTQQGCARQK